MTPREIGRASGRIFAATIPPKCAIRSQEDQEDFGIDYELEITDPDDQPTGLIFKIQQKGVESASLSKDKTWVSFSGLPVAKMTYYLQKVHIPVFFVLVDVATKSVWWAGLHGNPEIEKEYVQACKAEQKTMTVRLRVGNSLPDTFHQMITEVADARLAIILSMLRDGNFERLISIAKKTGHLEAAAESIETQHNLFRSEQIEDLIRRGDAKTAFNQSKSIFESESETFPMRFASALNLIRLFPATLDGQIESQRLELVIRYRVRIAMQLQSLSRRRSVRQDLRIYASILHRAARLRYAAQRDLGLHMALKAQDATGDDLTRAMTKARKTDEAGRVVNEFRHIQRRFMQLIDKKAYHLIAPAWNLMASDISPFVARLQDDQLIDARDQIIEWLDATFDLAMETTRACKDWPSIGMCTVGRLQSFWIFSNDKGRNATLKEENLKTLELIPEIHVRQHWTQRHNEYADLLASSHRQNPSSEDEESVIRQMATSLGVNFDDPNDQYARVIEVGLRDRNPGRVLKNCQHLRVRIDACGVPARMLGLPAAGFKTVYCSKFGCAVSALSLDDAYAMLHEDECIKCTECLPHRSDWEWSIEWQNAHYNDGKVPSTFGSIFSHESTHAQPA